MGDASEGLPANPESRTNATCDNRKVSEGTSAVRRQDNHNIRFVRDEDVAGIRERQDPYVILASRPQRLSV